MTLPWKNSGRRNVSKTASVPSPIGGLNARESAAAMPVTDALVLRNWFPFPYAVSMRKGWKELTVGLPHSNTPTVSVHHPKVGSRTIVAYTGGNIYTIHAPGVAPAPAVTGQTSDYWQTTMYSNIGGNYLYSVNGVDAPQIYDGVAFTAVAQVASPATGFNVSGVDPKKFIHVAIHQRRLWFVEKDSTQAWYLPVDQLGGDAAVFPVGQLWKFGGFLMAIYTWTVDSGDGMDDKLVLISSNGECAMYSGTDPSDPDAWRLEGVFRLGAPVGRRCGVKYGGDLLLLTTDGMVPISAALQSTRVNTADTLTDKIQHTISELISQYKSVVGWEMMLFYNENQVWLVVPSAAAVSPVSAPKDVVPGTIPVQIYAMNTISGAWCQFTNMDIRSTAIYNDNPVFITGDGRVCQAWTGFYDNVPWDKTVGERIELEVVTAYNYFEAMGVTKRWTMARPIFQAGTIPESAINLEVDFAVRTSLAIPGSVQAGSDYLWDDPRSLWDVAKWDQEYARFRRWQSIQGMGYAAALHMLVAQNVQTLWVATDYVFELGDTI
jgi:hypothetical protein